MRGISKNPKKNKCIECGREFVSNKTKRFCSGACTSRYWHHKKGDHLPLPTQPVPCIWCGKLFLPIRKGHICCSVQCKAKLTADIKYFDGKYRTAVGYKEHICWICGKVVPNGRRMSVHHVFGAHNASEPLVNLCAGCHQIVSLLANRTFLSNPHKVADLITLARFRKGLPDTRTIVEYEKT